MADVPEKYELLPALFLVSQVGSATVLVWKNVFVEKFHEIH
ncbi:hypothetical protein [Microcoleus sp. CAWBG58]|nr:hypothetical protein [Microcoleus sp. CAWBG58]